MSNIAATGVRNFLYIDYLSLRGSIPTAFLIMVVTCFICICSDMKYPPKTLNNEPPPCSLYNIMSLFQALSLFNETFRDEIFLTL